MNSDRVGYSRYCTLGRTKTSGHCVLLHVPAHDHACWTRPFFDSRANVSRTFVRIYVNIIIPCLATCNLAAVDRGNVTVPHVNNEIDKWMEVEVDNNVSRHLVFYFIIFERVVPLKTGV